MTQKENKLKLVIYADCSFHWHPINDFDYEVHNWGLLAGTAYMRTRYNTMWFKSIRPTFENGRKEWEAVHSSELPDHVRMVLFMLGEKP